MAVPAARGRAGSRGSLWGCSLVPELWPGLRGASSWGLGLFPFWGFLVVLIIIIIFFCFCFSLVVVLSPYPDSVGREMPALPPWLCKSVSWKRQIWK